MASLKTSPPSNTSNFQLDLGTIYMALGCSEIDRCVFHLKWLSLLFLKFQTITKVFISLNTVSVYSIYQGKKFKYFLLITEYHWKHFFRGKDFIMVWSILQSFWGYLIYSMFYTEREIMCVGGRKEYILWKC